MIENKRAPWWRWYGSPTWWRYKFSMLAWKLGGRWRHDRRLRRRSQRQWRREERR